MRAFALISLLSVVSVGCSFDDKHEKYPDPGDPSRPIVQPGRDPGAAQSATVPGWELAPPPARSGDPIVPPTYYSGPTKGAQPRPGAPTK